MWMPFVRLCGTLTSGPQGSVCCWTPASLWEMGCCFYRRANHSSKKLVSIQRLYIPPALPWGPETNQLCHCHWVQNVLICEEERKREITCCSSLGFEGSFFGFIVVVSFACSMKTGPSSLLMHSSVACHLCYSFLLLLFSQSPSPVQRPALESAMYETEQISNNLMCITRQRFRQPGGLSPIFDWLVVKT